MISLNEETLILLRDVPKHLPMRPNRKRLHVSAVYRWVTKGVAGVVLESVKLGAATYTSLEALQRFAEGQSRRGVAKTQPLRLPRGQRHQRAVSAQLEVELGAAPQGRRLLDNGRSDGS